MFWSLLTLFPVKNGRAQKNKPDFIQNVAIHLVIESDIPILFDQQADPESSAMAAFPSWQMR
jgi:hypothetical protein